MASACGTWEGSSALGSTMLELVDCQMRVAVEQSYGSLAGAGSPFGTALTLVLTIYVALLGFQLIFGRARLSIADLAPRLIAIGVVLALATNWPTYQRLVYDLLTNGPAQAAQWVSGSASAPSLLARVDDATTALVDVSEAWTKARSTPRPNPAEAPPPGSTAPAAPPPAATAEARLPPAVSAEGPTGPRLLTWSAILLLLISAGPLLAAKIVLGILLALGPLFLLFALFSYTRGLAVGWLRASAFLAIVPMLSVLSTAGALLLLEPVIGRIVDDAAEDRFSTVQALGLFAGTLVLAAATALLLRVAHMIASGWTIDVRRPSPTEQQGGSTFTERQGQAQIGALPRADQIAYAIERAAAAGAAPPGLVTPAAFRIEMPVSAGAAASPETRPGRRIGQAAAPLSAGSIVRPLRANEAR